MQSNSEASQGVSVEDKKRLVVFVGGFDPRGARYYHQLMRSQAAKQQELTNGTEYIVGKRSRYILNSAEQSPHSQWSVSQKSEKEHSVSEFIFSIGMMKSKKIGLRNARSFFGRL